MASGIRTMNREFVPWSFAPTGLVGQSFNMTSRTLRTIAASLCAAVLLLGASGCSRPDANAPVKITGDPAEANPVAPSTTLITTTATPTTLFYGAQ